MASRQSNGLLSPVISAHSPAPSEVGSTVGISQLPTQRNHPLKPGSPKEIALINYVDEKLLYITRRYGTKYTNIKTKANEPPGYVSFDQFVIDLDPLVDLVWATGTPTLQIPYMLNFAGLVSSYIPSFPFTPSLFRICKRLDTAFATLLEGHRASDNQRQEVSMTEKVRIKSLVDETRVVAVNQASNSGRPTDVYSSDSDDEDDDDGDEEEDGDVHQGEEDDTDDQDTALALSKIYKSTLEILGDSLAPGLPQFQVLPESEDIGMDLS